MSLLKFYKFFSEIFSKIQRKEIFILFILSIIAMIFETISIASIFPFLDYVFGGTENTKKIFILSNFITPGEKNYLVYLIILFIVIFLIKAIYLTYFAFKKDKFSFNIKTFQTNNLFNYYLNENYLFHIKNNSANLIRNLNDATLLSVYARSVVDVFAEIVMFLGILIFLLILSPEITIGLTTFFGLLGVAYYKLVQAKASKWGEESKIFRGLKLKNQQESFGAIRDIKILGKEKKFIDIFSFNNFQENECSRKHSFVLNLPRIWFEWLGVVAMFILIGYLAQNISDKTKIIPILGVFGLAAFRLIPSISKISNYLQLMKFCLPAVEPFIISKKHLGKDKNELSHKSNSKLIFSDKIKIQNLTYKFPDTTENILENLNLEIKKGECIGIHGRSGAGKTTLINLLLGLLTPNSGKICASENNINDNLKKWQDMISYIPQNVFITDDKIINNIALGENEKDIDINKINESMKISNIKDFVESLPHGINTMCGELGERFSGGQKQRLGIARAFYTDSEILVFDEFTNFLDINNERKILDEVSMLKGKKTIVMISHKASTLINCDKLYKLEGKKISV